MRLVEAGLVSVCAASVGIDGDDPDHIKWIYEHAVDRANQYGIIGVTYRLTQGKSTLSPSKETSVYYACVYKYVMFIYLCLAHGCYLCLLSKSPTCCPQGTTFILIIIILLLMPKSPGTQIQRCNKSDMLLLQCRNVLQCCNFPIVVLHQVAVLVMSYCSVVVSSCSALLQCLSCLIAVLQYLLAVLVVLYCGVVVSNCNVGHVLLWCCGI